MLPLVSRARASVVTIRCTPVGEQLYLSPPIQKTLKFHSKNRNLKTAQSELSMDQVRERAEAEAKMRGKAHPDFQKVEESRIDWKDRAWEYSKTKQPGWKFGDGANDSSWKDHKHIDIDPYAEDRNPSLNYKLLISAVVPRPIGFISTQSKDGSSTNLAPMSFTQMVHWDPPTFVIGFSCSPESPKDSLKNIRETGECVINIISEHFVEAANSTSINAPYGESEWTVSGLTPLPCNIVSASRVGEAIFSIEAKLMQVIEIPSKAKPGSSTGVTVLLEGVQFWAREDAVNEERTLMDIEKLRPVSRLGGITYGRVVDGFELLRPDYEKTMKDTAVKDLVKPKAHGQ